MNGSTQRLRLVLGVWIAALLVAGAVAALTDDSDDETETAASTTVSTLVGGDTLPGDTSSTLPGDTASTDTTVPGATTTTGAPAATTTTGPPATTPQTRIKPVAGTYQLRVSGTSTFGTQSQPVGPDGTLVIEELPNGDQRLTQPGGGGQQVMVIRWQRDAMNLVSLSVGVSSFSKTFAPNAPVLFVPFPADQGKTWSWSITSSDGKTKIDQQSRIVHTEELTIGGAPVSTAVVESVLNLSGDITGTINLTTWMAPDQRLPVKTHSVTNAKAGVFQFGADITTEFVSLNPS